MSHLTPPEPEIPDAVEHVWEWFWQLSNKRRSGMGGMEPLSFSDIGFWAQLTRSDPLPDEIELILKLDDAYMAAVRDEQAAKQQADKQKNQRR